MARQQRKESEYVLGHADSELERLGAQARLFEPMTRRLFVEAGIGPGMRVLDVGSGAGDVAFLAAELVGPDGEVVGTDRATKAVATAIARADARGIANVTFLAGDPTGMTFDRPFDAVVGRLVLMYYPDPVAALARIVRLVRPGGLVVFQETDRTSARAEPPTPLASRCIEVAFDTLAAAGSDVRIGPKLYRIFLEAGLPAPGMRIEASIGGSPDYAGFANIAALVRSLHAASERLGVARAAEIELEGLADRLRDEVCAAEGVLVLPSFVGAWSRTPDIRA
jgi:ubiquinone/menaquinone biosynthesis C-methylase UbiE